MEVTELSKSTSKKYLSRQCQSYYQLAHYADGLFQSYEARLASSEWQAALRLRKHKVLTKGYIFSSYFLSFLLLNNQFVQTRELDALIKRLKDSSKVSILIPTLQFNIHLFNLHNYPQCFGKHLMTDEKYERVIDKS